jgi:hypothetical protein
MQITPEDHLYRRPQIGEFYVNKGSGAFVEIMDVDGSGNVMVLDVAAPLDSEWQPLTLAQISSCFWVRACDYAAAA